MKVNKNVSKNLLSFFDNIRMKILEKRDIFWLLCYKNITKRCHEI